MKIGINSLDEFGGSLNSYYKEDLNSNSLTKMVKSLHQDLDVDVVEINASARGVRPELITEKTLRELAEYQENTGVMYTVHLPWRGIELANLIEEMREAGANYQRDLIKWFDRWLDVEHYVLHVQGGGMEKVKNSKKIDAESKKRILKKMSDQLRLSMLTILNATDSKRVSVENLEKGWEGPYALAKEFDTSICCDVGHLIIQGADVSKVIENHLDRINHVHYHDVIETESEEEIKLEDHVTLGTGLLNISETLKVLLDNNYEDVLLLEVKERSFADQSIEVLRSHLKELM